jgi:hypothetical protein
MLMAKLVKKLIGADKPRGRLFQDAGKHKFLQLDTLPAPS